MGTHLALVPDNDQILMGWRREPRLPWQWSFVHCPCPWAFPSGRLLSPTATPETGIGEQGPWELQSVHLHFLLLQIVDPRDCIRK